MKSHLCLIAFLIATSVLASEPLEVRTVVPAPATEGRSTTVPGRTEAIESATIFARATGIIRERKLEIGNTTKAGDILAVVDAPEIDRAVEAAQANVEQALARASNARNLSARSSRLLKSDVVSQEESEQRQTDAIGAAAAVKVAQAELARLEEQQRFSVVRAPFDGVISARNLDRGDHVRGDSSGADGWIYRLNRLDTLRFVVSATPDLVLRLVQGGEARVRFGEFPGRDFPARVAHSSRVFDASSGTMRVELLLENPDLAIPAGLTGTASFDLPPVAGTYLVPTNALVLREGRTMVATSANGAVHFLEVLAGRNLGRDVEVTSSRLSPASEVILNPNAMLREGDAVKASPLRAVTSG